MKFVVVTYGTEGDTRPLALLCRALMDSGHNAHLLADAATLGYAALLGVSTTPLTGDMRSVLQQEVKAGAGFGDAARAFAGIATANSESWLRAIMAAAEGGDAIIVGSLAAFAGLSAAEALGIPGIGAGLIPITPTRDFASPFLPPGLLPRWLNRASHKLGNTLLWRAFKTPINAARAEVCGLPPRDRVWTENPMLYGISPSLVPQPADWPAHAQICGPWLAPVADWTPPPALADFLAAGEPPIYLGFGSMGTLSGAAVLREAVAALRGRRALFYPGWGGMGQDELPANMHLLAEAPHGWLFPHMALVVHHGGAGTSHAAARAGVPSVVVPFAGDQPFWAARLHRTGAAPAPVPAKGLSAERLEHAIAEADRDAPRAAAAALAAAIVQEDGLRHAVTCIEAIARRAHA
jgi:sterol 3beta-glucosyltransferase